MRAISNLLRRISARDGSVEGGFTLIELMLTIFLLLIVVGSLVAVFESVQRSSAFVEERSQTLDRMRLAVDVMTKEIRQASVVDPASTASRLEMTTYVLDVEKTIVFEVTGENLTRSVDGGPPATIQENVNSSTLFSYTKDVGGVVQLVAVNLQVHPIRKPNTIVELESEVRLRNKVVA